MVGDVAAAINLVEGDAAAGQHFVGGKNIGSSGVTAQRKHGRVLKQEQHIADAPLLAQGDEFLLQAQGLGVVHAAEI